MKSNRFDYKNSPVVWFSIMEIESGRGNFKQAAVAKQQLERLGIFVRFKGVVQRRYEGVERVLTKQQKRSAPSFSLPNFLGEER